MPQYDQELPLPSFSPYPEEPQLAVPFAPHSPEYGASPVLFPEVDQDFVQTQGQPAIPGPVEHLGIAAPSQSFDVYGNAPAHRPSYGTPPVGPAPNDRLVMAQAIGQDPESATGGSVGLVFLGLVAGLAAGAHFGGVTGAAVGTLLGGAGVNVIRAAGNVRRGTPEGDREARISLLYGVAGAGAGVFAWMKYVTPRKMTANPESTVYVIGDDADLPDRMNQLLGPSHCDIRPAGPSR